MQWRQGWEGCEEEDVVIVVKEPKLVVEKALSRVVEKGGVEEKTKGVLGKDGAEIQPKGRQGK